MKVVTIGRSSNSAICIQDKSEKISRLHAELRLLPDGQMMLVDKSANGTWVNGQRIQRGKAFFVYRNDAISFAGVATLDWSKVSDVFRNETALGTNFLHDIRSMMDQVTDYSGLRHSLSSFGKLVVGGHARVLEFCSESMTSRRDAMAYYGLGVVGTVVCLSKSPLTKQWFNFRGNDDFDFLLEVLLSMMLALVTFAFAALNYTLFKWMTHSQQKWRNYFRMYCYTFGTCFWLVPLCLLPSMVLALFYTTSAQPQDLDFVTIPTVAGLSAIAFGTMWVWVRANITFWE